MKYLTYSQIDNQFRCLERDLPEGAIFNRVDPFEGIHFNFALTSQYPLLNKEPAIYYGVTDVDFEDNPDILLREVTGEEFSAAKQSEVDYFDNLNRVKPEEVDAERDRRMDYGFVFNNKFFQSRVVDRENILGAAQLAHMAITIGGKSPTDTKWHGGQEDFVWIAADNSLEKMNAITVIQFGQKAAEHKSAHTFAARELKNADPIPTDYRDDAYWPVLDEIVLPEEPPVVEPNEEEPVVVEPPVDNPEEPNPEIPEEPPVEEPTDDPVVEEPPIEDELPIEEPTDDNTEKEELNDSNE